VRSAAGTLPDIQFDIGSFIAPAFTQDGVLVRLERFITATRRQNSPVPSRRHRAFPLLELT
jgi:hypothetical protein